MSPRYTVYIRNTHVFAPTGDWRLLVLFLYRQSEHLTDSDYREKERVDVIY
jgi:hypothetical protein